MAIPTQLTTLSGKFQGAYQLWLSPEAPVRESESTATISPNIKGRYSEIRYTWTDQGEPQEGTLIVSPHTEEKAVSAVWLDSWHTMDGFMIFDGTVQENGGIHVQGTYPAPPGPDWGWEIIIEPPEQDTFRIVMYNVTPDGNRMLAVDVTYNRQE